MKKSSLLILFICLMTSGTFAQEFMQMTTIESVVPGGLGRSRMITTGPDGYQEEKMENFFSMVGINFENVSANDVQISAKLNELSSQGWNLENVTSGVYSSGESTGIFITRYLFKKDQAVPAVSAGE